MCARQKSITINVFQINGLYFLSGRMIYREISGSLEATGLGAIMTISHWNLTCRCVCQIWERLENLNLNFAASKLHEILQWDFMNRGLFVWHYRIYQITCDEVAVDHRKLAVRLSCSRFVQYDHAVSGRRKYSTLTRRWVYPLAQEFRAVNDKPWKQNVP